MRSYHAVPLSIIVAGTVPGLGRVAVPTTASPASFPVSLRGARNLSHSENASNRRWDSARHSARRLAFGVGLK